MKRKLALKKNDISLIDYTLCLPEKFFMCFKKKENIARLFAEDTLGASVTLNRTWLHKKFSH